MYQIEVTMLKSIVTELKNTLVGVKQETTWTISKDQSLKTGKWKSPNQSNIKEKKKNKKIQESIRDFGSNIKWTNMHIMELPEGEDREKWAEILFSEILTEKLFTIGKETDIQIQEPRDYKDNEPKKTQTKALANKMSMVKYKEGILKASKEK